MSMFTKRNSLGSLFHPCNWTAVADSSGKREREAKKATKNDILFFYKTTAVRLLYTQKVEKFEEWLVKTIELAKMAKSTPLIREGTIIYFYADAKPLVHETKKYIMNYELEKMDNRKKWVFVVIIDIIL